MIIGFEESEIYLHPNTINKMRDTIYSLAPITFKVGECEALTVACMPFNITKEFLELQEDEKNIFR